ncbi:putative testis-expressed protein 10/pre-rRNA-processing protein Ipi1 [Helianthus annuus]|nr:putative testis-expressed protein 10/pre-rRNA-processing protein Ipi1 [Helianthus annuus]KAJ0564873.1 putative testis-expressed protein 10/pre-rRNA-processing protein Ipi1 [Helianthus annuus]KAJ0571950.1 putative testis-expressed protein 10/pre-rRNA-processing protein Ipi1 [Helianthus annuus]KAJ0739364.1 putative testis-expressed protein 10/pre-rRNA-processing protein Ipi1 [Helianthus annuus]KAJ0910023.1 putative testis-expressed protein 10/pre-rRNA-processing protein Ipi1 [Helianthus annuus
MPDQRRKLRFSVAFFQKHFLSLIPFIPKLVMQVDNAWKSHILQAFTEVFKKCDPESSMKLVCLSAVEEMLFLDVLRLQLHLAQCGTHSQELDNMQYTLREFYSTCPCDGDISYGPFMKLEREIQELSVCCLYYFSFMDPSLLQSVAGCCLCEYFNNMMRK